MVMAFTVLDSVGRVSGTTRFLRMAEDHRRLEIGGTVYARRVQRTGLNTDATRLLLTHAFEALGCPCVPLSTDTLNPQPHRATPRLGPRHHGARSGPHGYPGTGRQHG